MNTEIIPAINAATFADIEKRVRQVESLVRWVHLDIADGTFTPNVLWNNPADLAGFETPLQIEAHLMVRNPELVIGDWIAAGAKRIIVHVEALREFEEIKQKCDSAKVFLMLAITPETSWTILMPYLQRHVVAFQILAVHPGLAGQQFIDGGDSSAPYIESSYEKIKRLREQCNYCDIEVDGGVKIGIAKKCREAGANAFAVASAIFGAPDAAKAIENLKRDVA